MKPTLVRLTVIVPLFLCTLAFAGDVPKAVQQAFETRFRNATNITWDRENTHEFEAAFEWNGSKHSATFSDSGEWRETESASTFSRLPPKVQEAYNANHKGSKVKAVAVIETSKGISKYEIEIAKGSKTVELFYDGDGNGLNQ